MIRSATVSVVIACAVLGCSKSEKKEPAPTAGSGSAAAGSAAAGSGSAEVAEPVEAAAVSGPTKSATGTLEVTGLAAGKYEWIKKDQRAPISCAWDHEKEIGGVKIDVSDGAGKLLTLTLDVPPADDMMMVKNDDRPGVIGLVGTLLGNAGVNIADMDVGRAQTPGTAVMLIAPTAEVPTEVVDELRAAPGIIDVFLLDG